MQRRETRYYEEIEIGDEIGPVEKYITDEEVEAFCRLWGAPVPNRFTDEDSAARVNLSWPIVPGIMSMAIMSQIFTAWEGAALKHLDVIFRQPVPHDLVAITAIVTDTREENDEYLAECDVYLSTEENGRLVGGKAIIGLASQVEAEAEPDDDEEFEDDDLDDDFDEDEDDLDDDDTEEDQPEGDAPGAEEPAQDDPAQDGSDGDDGPAEEVVTNEQGEGGGDEKAG
jgi:acyl dehydratase